MDYREAVDFLKKSKGKIGIFFDNDADGTSAAALLLAYFKERNVKAESVSGTIEKHVFDNFGKEDFDFYIFCDFPLSFYPEFLEPFVGKNVMIIDHHPIQKDLNKMGFIFINPRVENPEVYISTSHLVLDICNKAGLKNFEWLARIGMSGDREIVGSQEEKEASNIINSIAIVKGIEELPKVAKFLSGCKRIEEFVYKKEYQKINKIVDRNIDKNVESFVKSGIKDVNFFESKSKYGIASTISTKLFDMYPDKTIIVYSRGKDHCKISGRTRKFDIGKIFKEASEGLGSGGGHPVAASAKIDSKDFNEFKKRLIRMIKSESG